MAGLCTIAGRQVGPAHPLVRVTGRTKQADDGGVRFDLQGTSIEAKVLVGRGATVCTASVLMAALHPSTGFEPEHFAYILDGVVLNAKDSWMSAFNTSLSANNTAESYLLPGELSPGEHHLRIVKLTEPEWNEATPAASYVTYGGLDFGCDDVVLLPLDPRPSRRIEFLGDSITCGFCNLCDAADYPGMDNGASTESALLSWPLVMCDQLGAECHIDAWSGYGLVEGCCGQPETMATVYRRTLATVDGSEGDWDWSTWVPDAVVINLGTNDQLGGRPEIVSNFTDAYAELAANMTATYPGVTLFMACGPMDEAYCDVVMNLTSTLDNAVFVDQRGFLDGSHGEACCGHPGTQIDAAMAVATAETVASAMGWH